MTTQTLNVPSFLDSSTQAAGATANPVDLLTPDIKPDNLIAAAQTALTEAEFASFVESLDGGEEIEKETLQLVAKALAPKLKEVSASKQKISSLEARVKELDEKLEANATKTEEVSKKTNQERQYSELSAACGKEGVDLETALADETFRKYLQEESKDEFSANTFSEEVQRFMAKGDYKKSALLIKRAIEKAGKPFASVAPSSSGGSAGVFASGTTTFESELAAVTAAYSRSTKTYDDQVHRTQAIDALRKKYGR